MTVCQLQLVSATSVSDGDATALSGLENVQGTSHSVEPGARPAGPAPTTPFRWALATRPSTCARTESHRAWTVESGPQPLRENRALREGPLQCHGQNETSRRMSQCQIINGSTPVWTVWGR